MRRIPGSICLLVAAALAAGCEEPQRYEVETTASGSLVVLPGEEARLHETRVYSDRNYTFSRLTRLGGLRHVATANDDKAVVARNFLELRAGPRTTVYLAFDRRAGGPPAPAWLAEEGFDQQAPCDPPSFQITITDRAPRWVVYCRPPSGHAHRLVLGGNVDRTVAPTAPLSMYLIFYRGDLQPPVPEEAGPPHARARLPAPAAAGTTAATTATAAAGATAATAAAPAPFRQLTAHGAEALCLGGPPPGPAELLAWSPTAPTQRADLRCARLSRLDFSATSLDLRGSDLIASNLQFSNLSTAVLDHAEMEYANLADATLARTSLRGANLVMADLSRAKLIGADLSEANLRGARLDDADFTGADLERAIFEPQSLTSVRKIGRARGLDRLRYLHFPDALISLRDSFKQAGYHHQERQVTAAIERQYEVRAAWYGRWARRLLLGLTCDYGLEVGRPLLLIVASLLLFPLLYYLCVRWVPGSKLQLIDDSSPAPRDLPPRGGWPYYFRLSLVSAFALGDQFGIGKWIESLLPSPISVRPRGPLRTLAGIQSLVDLLLLGLWALIFLGRPFE
jgi:Pentapeptide repeats (8 copies)